MQFEVFAMHALMVMSKSTLKSIHPNIPEENQLVNPNSTVVTQDNFKSKSLSLLHTISKYKP